MALPVAAEVSPVVPAVSFVTGPTGGTAEWSAGEANDGSYSIALSTEGVPYTSESDYGEGRLIMPVDDLALGDVANFSVSLSGHRY